MFRSLGATATLAHVQLSFTEQAAHLFAEACSLVVFASCFALQVAAGDNVRGKPTDYRRAAKCVEVALETRGVQRYGIYGSSTG